MQLHPRVSFLLGHLPTVWRVLRTYSFLWTPGSFISVAEFPRLGEDMVPKSEWCQVMPLPSIQGASQSIRGVSTKLISLEFQAPKGSFRCTAFKAKQLCVQNVAPSHQPFELRELPGLCGLPHSEIVYLIPALVPSL